MQDDTPTREETTDPRLAEIDEPWVPFSGDGPSDAPRPPTQERPGWIEFLARFIPQSEPDSTMDYPEPDWSAWVDRDVWPTWIVLPPLLLEHDPLSAMNAPYFNAGWCAANPRRQEVHVMRAVVWAASEGSLGERVEGSPCPGGYQVKSLDAVAWARGMASIYTPPELVKACTVKRQRLAAVEAWRNGAPLAEVVGSDADPMPPLPNKKDENRPSIAAYFALRYAGIDVRGEPGAQALGMLGGKAPSERYLAPSGDWFLLFESFKAYADGRPGRWARVFDTIRQWASLGDPPS